MFLVKFDSLQDIDGTTAKARSSATVKITDISEKAHYIVVPYENIDAATKSVRCRIVDRPRQQVKLIEIEGVGQEPVKIMVHESQIPNYKIISYYEIQDIPIARARIEIIESSSAACSRLWIWTQFQGFMLLDIVTKLLEDEFSSPLFTKPSFNTYSGETVGLESFVGVFPALLLANLAKIQKGFFGLTLSSEEIGCSSNNYADDPLLTIDLENELLKFQTDKTEDYIEIPLSELELKKHVKTWRAIFREEEEEEEINATLKPKEIRAIKDGLQFMSPRSAQILKSLVPDLPKNALDILCLQEQKQENDNDV